MACVWWGNGIQSGSQRQRASPRVVAFLLTSSLLFFPGSQYQSDESWPAWTAAVYGSSKEKGSVSDWTPSSDLENLTKGWDDWEPSTAPHSQRNCLLRSPGWNSACSGALAQASQPPPASGASSWHDVHIPRERSRPSARRPLLTADGVPARTVPSLIENSRLISCGSSDCGSSARAAPTTPQDPQAVLSAPQSELVGRRPAFRQAAPACLSEGGTVRATACPGPDPSAAAAGCPDSAGLRAWWTRRRCSRRVGSALGTCSRPRWRRAGTAEVWRLDSLLFLHRKNIYFLHVCDVLISYPDSDVLRSSRANTMRNLLRFFSK